MEIFILLCSKFFNKSEDEVYNLIKDSEKIYTNNWSEIVYNEDNVTPGDLYKFYNSFEFPVGYLFPLL